VRTSSPHEDLARERRRFERLLLARMGTTITREDAEDIVSEALLRGAVPQPEGSENARRGAMRSRRFGRLRGAAASQAPLLPRRTTAML